MVETEKPRFTLADIKYSTDDGIFARAIELFRRGKVEQFSAHRRGYSAIVKSTQNYRVSVSQKRMDYADCDCYMGQNDELCKHMLAVGIKALYEAGAVDDSGEPTDENRLDPASARQHIAAGLRKIRVYDGPSRTWFAYQRNLDVGAGMITEGAQALEPNLDNAKYLWKLVVKLSKKLSQGGVDDSNGIIGGAIDAVIMAIANMAMVEPEIRQYGLQHFTDDTGFEFEMTMADQLNKQM